MTTWRPALPRRRVRIVVYLLVVLGLFLWRGPASWEQLLRTLQPEPPGAPTLRLSGRELAPSVVDALLRSYRRDYPEVQVHEQGSGTTHALEALLTGRADAAFLSRPPSLSEQALFVEADGEAPIVEAVATGALVLLASIEATADVVTWSRLRQIAAGSSVAARLVCEDPNLGVADVLWNALGVDRAVAEGSGAVVFARDRDELYGALRADPDAFGVVSSFELPVGEVPVGLRLVAVRGPEADEAVLPTYPDVGAGRYPLVHHLHVACRADATGEAAKFVTFTAGPRGQRIVERAGFLPARQFLREILLDERPIGAR